MADAVVLAVAALLLAAVVAYGVLGGADFGGGIWDALASGPRKRAQREAIAQAMGPVWEANHVWLIFAIVLVFTGFPVAFGVLSIALFVPFHLVLVGIALRGAAFVFRAYSPQSGRQGHASPARRRWGAVFGAASLVTPLLLGMCVGAVSAGALRVEGGEVRIEGTPPWLSPVALAVGAFAVAICAYVAAVYLTNETTGALREDFRTRALWCGTGVVALSVLVLPVMAWDAPHLWRGLGSARALPVVLLGVAAALASGWALWQRRWRLARVATIAQVAGLVAGWGLAQYPWFVYPDLRVVDVAGPRSTLLFVLASTPVGMALLVPSLRVLFRVFKAE